MAYCFTLALVSIAASTSCLTWVPCLSLVHERVIRFRSMSRRGFLDGKLILFDEQDPVGYDRAHGGGALLPAATA